MDAAYQIHFSLGPGLLESVYEALLVHELRSRSLSAVRQWQVPLVYGQIRLPVAFRADLLVGGQVIVEIKSVDAIIPVHKGQLLTYLRLSGKRLGLLINFDLALIKDGITRIVNGLPD